MDPAMKTFLIISQALSFAELRAYAIEGPEDAIAYLGDDVTIRCASETNGCSTIDWSRRLGQSSSGSPSWGYENIFKNNFLINVDVTRYSVDNTSGCHVVIRNIQYGDSGRYSCEAILWNKATAVKSGYLIVLKSRPECKVSLPTVSDGSVTEGDAVTFTCESTYAGTEGYMTWKGVENNASKAETVNRTHMLSYSVVVGASGVSSPVCEVRFTFEGKDADVNPLMVTCQTPPVDVLYAVKTAILSPSLSVYSPGTFIACFSDGNPSPSYKWQIKHVIRDGKSENWKDMFGETDKELIVNIATFSFFRCVNRNTIRGSSYVAISEAIQVNYMQRESADSTALEIKIAFFLSGAVCTLLLVISVVFLLKHLRYIQFHRNRTPKAATDVGQRQYMNMDIVGGMQSAVQAVAPSTRDEGDVTAYASLEDDCREYRPYESLGSRPNRIEH